jgi:hypothetical protein
MASERMTANCARANGGGARGNLNWTVTMPGGMVETATALGRMKFPGRNRNAR